ncbi:GNAT family N-acetyltransferase [Chelativorans sp. AA-79]|uniref:GNAT family N-acetyltransferase n=1 Tax=Chelativorans sp. AA-79 TaxID=3028735 RepID=UPI0023F928A5|nr:GNAT family N-acetyltransferase [Chelativorans sp. AA-79]WEX08907.1 GNAT family N-acetyltransferase [Chelativorans sp. AA-79]
MPYLKRYTIRHATWADIPALHVMQIYSLLVLGGDFYSPEEIAGYLSEIGTMDEAVFLERHYYVAVNQRGAILGSGGWSQFIPDNGAGPGEDLKGGVATIGSVFVGPAVARRGIASAIMAVAEEDAAEHGIRRLEAAATLSSVPLFERLGYTAIRSGDIVLSGGARFRCMEMAKALPSRHGRSDCVSFPPHLAAPEKFPSLTS